MKAKELRDKSDAELGQHKLNLLEDMFKLRMQKSTGQLAQTHLLRAKRRELARVNSVLAEKAGK